MATDEGLHHALSGGGGEALGSFHHPAAPQHPLPKARPLDARGTFRSPADAVMFRQAFAKMGQFCEDVANTHPSQLKYHRIVLIHKALLKLMGFLDPQGVSAPRGKPLKKRVLPPTAAAEGGGARPEAARRRVASLDALISAASAAMESKLVGFARPS